MVEFDKDTKKIVLSAVEFLKGKESKILEDYMAQHRLAPTTIGDAATITGGAPAGDTSIPTEN